MNRKGKIYYKDLFAGIVTEDENEYNFKYEKEYLENPEARPISLTLPLREESYSDKVLFPFFDGLIPEGWILGVAVKNWKINPRDRMELLLTFCKETIGAVSVERIEEKHDGE
ncbi:MAG: HipA N-terminal domain-containing protein [Melioribacteraceae bacterium]|nr:HipA N-terminal domain-containing protein [Melioribacteraceae bacterium]